MGSTCPSSALCWKWSSAFNVLSGDPVSENKCCKQISRHVKPCEARVWKGSKGPLALGMQCLSQLSGWSIGASTFKFQLRNGEDLGYSTDCQPGFFLMQAGGVVPPILYLESFCSWLLSNHHWDCSCICWVSWSIQHKISLAFCSCTSWIVEAWGHVHGHKQIMKLQNAI